MTDHPLERLEGLPLGPLFLCLSRLDPMRMSGWRRFSLEIRNAEGVGPEAPVADGIFSAGGKGIAPWIEVAVYRPRTVLPAGRILDLPSNGLDVRLFRALHDLLQPGSHHMLWYEGQSGEGTERALAKRVPAVLTPLGLLLFQAGFLSVRDFHLPEGGQEGGRKLWAERPLNEGARKAQEERARDQATGFFLRPIRPGLLEIEVAGRENALRLLGLLSLPRPDAARLRRMAETLESLKRGSFPPREWPQRVGGLGSSPLAG